MNEPFQLRPVLLIQAGNVVTIIAWAGVGKSPRINHWLRRMAAEGYRSAQLVFGWSFYRQGTSGGTSSGDEFLARLLVGLEVQVHGSSFTL